MSQIQGCTTYSGWIAVALASVVFSATPVAISRYRGSISSSVIFNGLRALFALPVALTLFVLVPRSIDVHQVLVALPYVFLSTLAPLVGDVMYITSIRILGSSLAATISYTYVFFVQPIALALGESVKLSAAIGAAIAFLGIAMALGGGDGSSRFRDRDFAKGILYAFSTSIVWAVSTPMLRYALRYIDVITIFPMRLAIVFTALALPTPRTLHQLANRDAVKALLIAGTAGWGIGMLMFIYSVSCLGSVATAIGTSMVPVLTLLLSKLWVRERTSLRVVIGTTMVAVGIALTALA